MREDKSMTLLSIALMGIVTAFVMASEGDYSGLKMIGTILLYNSDWWVLPVVPGYDRMGRPDPDFDNLFYRGCM